MSLSAEKSFRMKMRDVETAFKYRRFPYPKRSVELIALLAISCTFFLFMHTNKLNSRLKEMEMKLQPSEFSALGLTGSNHLDAPKREDINTLHGTYQYLKSTGQLESLNAQQLNNTRLADIDILFFNRLEKVGSISMTEFLNTLSEINDFIPHRNAPYPEKNLLQSAKEEFELAEEIMELPEASSYVEHINYINFTKLELPRPIYINLVRHPIQKVMSAYYYIRTDYVYKKYERYTPMTAEQFNMTFNECVKRQIKPFCVFEPQINYNHDWRRLALYFCGNKKICLQFNSQTATQIAKRNIEQDYAVVGTWEETNITLTVLEHYIPRFFKDATKIFYSDVNKYHKNATPHKTELEPEVEAKLKIQFAYEIELYNFCLQRLYKQYIAIKKDEMMKKFGGYNRFPFNILT